MSNATPYQRKLIDETFASFVRDWRELVDGRKSCSWQDIVKHARESLDDLARACSALDTAFQSPAPNPLPSPPIAIGAHPALGQQEGLRIHEAVRAAAPVILASCAIKLAEVIEADPARAEDPYHAVVQACCMVTHAMEGIARSTIRDIVNTDLWRTIEVRILLSHELFVLPCTRAEVLAQVESQAGQSEPTLQRRA